MESTTPKPPYWLEAIPILPISEPQTDDALSVPPDPIRFYQAIVESMDEAVVVYDQTGRLVVANHNAHDLLGLEAVGRWYHRDWQAIFEDGTSLNDAYFPPQVTLQSGEALHRVILGLQKPSTETTWVVIGTRPLNIDGTAAGVVMTVHDISQRLYLERSLNFIAQRGARYGNRPYLEAVALYLTEVFKVDGVLIGALLSVIPEQIRSQTYLWKGAFVETIDYGLANTPCENVVNRDFSFYPREVARIFPLDDYLTEMRIESYAGVPLYDSNGQPLGILTIFSRQPMHRELVTKNVLEMFAVSVAHELEQIRSEAERQRLQAELDTYRHHLEVLVDQRTIQLANTNARLEREIEERIQAEAALHTEKERTETILRHVANPVIFADIHANILYTNPAFEQFYGYSLAEVRGQNPRLLQSGNTPPATYDKMWSTILSGRAWSGLLFNRTKSGQVVDIMMTIVPVLDTAGVIQHFVAVHQDMTESRRFAALKEAFIANAAHDLANPVAALDMTLSLLKAAPDLFDQRLPVLERQVRRLDGLVNDLLLVSRLDRKMMQPQLAPLNLNALVQTVVESQQIIAQQKNIGLELQPCAKPLVVQADAQQLERVVVNLIANALNYTLEGGAVRLVIERTSHHAVLMVRDTGIGIAPNDLPHIFERFYRTETAQQHSHGTGLGLSIVKEILDLHLGTIEVESVEGQGTTFRVYLPLA